MKLPANPNSPFPSISQIVHSLFPSYILSYLFSLHLIDDYYFQLYPILSTICLSISFDPQLEPYHQMHSFFHHSTDPPINLFHSLSILSFFRLQISSGSNYQLPIIMIFQHSPFTVYVFTSSAIL